GVRHDDGEHEACLGLVHALRSQHFDVSAMTPLVSDGTCRPGRRASRELQRLADASSIAWPVSALCPYPLPMAQSPAEAARLAGVQVDPDVVMDAVQVLSTWSDIVVVQGAGGLAAPLGAAITLGNLAAHLRLPLVLALRPARDGESRAREAVAQAQATGLHIVAWVATPTGDEPGSLMGRIARMQAILDDVPYLGSLTQHDQFDAEATIAGRTLDAPRLVATLRAALSQASGSRTAQLQS